MSRLVNVILLGLVLGGVILGALALGNAVRRYGNEEAAQSSQAQPQTQTQTTATASGGSNGHSTRRLEVLTAAVVGGLLVVFVLLSALGSFRRGRRRRERWHG